MIVLDASAAVRTVMDKGSPFQAMLKTADLVIAPELIVAEVCSAFRKYVRARVLSSVEAEKLIERALSLVDQLQPLRELVPAVLDSHPGSILRPATYFIWPLPSEQARLCSPPTLPSAKLLSDWALKPLRHQADPA